MPYTAERNRTYPMRKAIQVLSNEIRVKGDLNYVICQLLGELILRDGIGYTTMSNWIDALPDAEDEARRRLLHPYENKMKEKNGDVESFEEILNNM